MQGFVFIGVFGMILASAIIKLKQHNNMRGLLYIIAVILIIGWALGFFYYSAGGVIHILLVIAIIALLLGIIRRA